MVECISLPVLSPELLQHLLTGRLSAGITTTSRGSAIMVAAQEN